MYIIVVVIVSANQSFKDLQGEQTLFVDQNRLSEKFARDTKYTLELKAQTFGVDLLTVVRKSNLVLHLNSMLVRWSGLLSFVEDLGSFLCSTADKLDLPSQNETFELFSYVAIKLCKGTRASVALCDGTNAPRTSRFFPTRPHRLLTFYSRSFYELLREQINRLFAILISELVYGLEEGFTKLPLVLS